MTIINKQDTNGTKPLLSKGEFGYDDYAAGGDVGRVYIGTGTENLLLAFKNGVGSGPSVLSPTPTTVGEPSGGGYYFATSGGYYLICAPISGQSQQTWNNGINFCNSLAIGGYTDWYLPSKTELNLLYQNHITLTNAGAGSFVNTQYWSNTEYLGDRAWLYNFISGAQFNFPKDNNYYVRAIRRSL